MMLTIIFSLIGENPISSADISYVSLTLHPIILSNDSMLHKLKSAINKVYNNIFFYSYRSKPAKEVFEDIYQKKSWSGESHSGPGSDLEQTRLVREGLGQVIDEYHVQSLLDVPCGDWFWMKSMDLKGVTYVGGDIVEEIIRRNQQYASEQVSFQFLNLLEPGIPAHDLVFCRDCLVHFSYHDIYKALDNLKSSGSQYLLTTTFPGRRNYNIITGNWRPIDLQAAPFNLESPILVINEGCTEGNGSYADKSLGLWDLGKLKRSWGV